jgi:DNA replication protein DnaC
MSTFESHRAFEQRKWPGAATDCKGTLHIEDQSGPIWTIVCDRCRFEAGLPARDADPSVMGRAEIARAASRRDASGIPLQLRGLNFDAITNGNRPEVVTAARAWAAGELHGLLLTGPVGVGKTWTAAAAAWAWAECGPLRWFFVPNLFTRLSLEFGDPMRAEALKALAAPDPTQALVLDDLDKVRGTPAAIEHLLTAIDDRVTAGAPLLITTNLELSALADRYGEAIVSRLVGYCDAYGLKGHDRRTERLAS